MVDVSGRRLIWLVIAVSESMIHTGIGGACRAWMLEALTARTSAKIDRCFVLHLPCLCATLPQNF